MRLFSCLKLSKNAANGIWSVQLNRPERLNALSEQMGEEIIELCEGINKSIGLNDVVACKGLLLKGSDRAFSTGRDLKLSKLHTNEQSKRYLELAIESVLAVYNLDVPTCCVIDGYAIGWGLELALAADARFVTHRAQFRLPETSLGLFPGAGETRAKELILTAKSFHAAEAVEMGLAKAPEDNKTSAAEAAESYLASCAENAPLAIRAAKQAFRGMGLRSDAVEAIRLSQRLREPLTHTQDHREALSAFAEKRKPKFTGR